MMFRIVQDIAESAMRLMLLSAFVVILVLAGSALFYTSDKD